MQLRMGQALSPTKFYRNEKKKPQFARYDLAASTNKIILSYQAIQNADPFRDNLSQDIIATSKDALT
jgi:hypothetical protein